MAGRTAETREDCLFLAAARSRVTPVSAASADCRFVDVVLADTEDPIRSRSSSSEIETMVRLAEPTVVTGTERDCRLGEATGLVVA